MAQVFWPFPTSTVSEWPGQRSDSYHVGTDFAIPQGTPLRATIDGVITRHNNDGLGAYVLDIMSDDGLLVRNGHLSRMDVVTGQRVTAGQVIGLTGGARGTAGAGNSFGPHLHWELRRDRAWNGGAWIDPRNLNPQPSTFGAAPAPTPIPEESDNKMYSIAVIDKGAAYLWNMATGEHRWIDADADWKRFDAALEQYKFASEAEFAAFRQKYPFKVSAQVDANAVANAVAGSIKIDVNVLAQAIADKIGTGTVSDVTTKDDILTAIEANYPEGK